MEAGDRVGYLGPNHPGFIETMFATWSMGAVFTPLNFRLPESDLVHIIGDAGLSLLVYDHSLDPTVESLQKKIELERYLRVGGDPGQGRGLEELAASELSPAARHGAVSLDDLCMLVYTSGSTGLPKGVMLTHSNLTWNVYNMLHAAEFTQEDATLAWAPFFRLGGLAVTVLGTLQRGGRVVIVNEAKPREVLRVIEHRRVTVVFSGPDLCASLSQLPEFDSADLSSVRIWMTGGAPVPESMIRLYQSRNIPFLQGYGLTEASPAVLLLQKEDAVRKVGSAGKPLFFTDIRIVRPDLTDVMPGEIGELLARGPNIMKGYWNQPAATKETIVDGGWLRTGDAARFDAEGYIFIVDRMKDAFISQGEQVFPSQVEEIISQHPKISGCAVAGVSDKETELTGIAFVVLKEGVKCSAEDLLDFCKARLPPSKLPKTIVFVEEIPRNPAGKVLRHRLLANVDA
jgi:fatty-acyl-CoA synthase